MGNDVRPLTGSPFGSVPSKTAARLCNFATASDHLLIEHQKWIGKMLNETVRSMPYAWIEIVGYASKRGNAQNNYQLSINRCRAVENFIKFIVEQVDGSLFGRITYIKGHPKGEELSDGQEEDNDGYWRAVEVYVYATNPPPRPSVPVPVPKEVDMKWSVKGYPGYMHSVGIAQFGVAFYKFRNDESMKERIFFSLQFGVGVSAADLLKWIKFLKDKGQVSLEVMNKIMEKLMKIPNLTFTQTPGEILKTIGKEIAEALIGGGSVPFEYSFTPCKVHQPLTFDILNLQTIGGKSASYGAGSAAHSYVYGKTWYTEQSGKRMHGTRDLLDFDSGGSGFQFPGLGASGGPLIML